MNEPDRNEKIASLDVAIWLPANPGPSPLVLFSHGVLGCNTQSKYLMRALAQNGFVVAAANHKDNRCGQQISLEDLPPEFQNPAGWSDDTFADRGDDMKDLLSGVLAHKTLAARIDSAKVTLVSHSLGGYTVLALAGARASWKMDGIVGVVALAPYTEPFLTAGTVGSISVPVLLEVGEQDKIAGVSGTVFSTMSSPACRVIYRGGWPLRLGRPRCPAGLGAAQVPGCHG